MGLNLNLRWTDQDQEPTIQTTMDNANGDPASREIARRGTLLLAIVETGSLRPLPAGATLHAGARAQVACQARRPRAARHQSRPRRPLRLGPLRLIRLRTRAAWCKQARSGWGTNGRGVFGAVPIGA